MSQDQERKQRKLSRCHVHECRKVEPIQGDGCWATNVHFLVIPWKAGPGQEVPGCLRPNVQGHRCGDCLVRRVPSQNNTVRCQEQSAWSRGKQT